jgi:hypothetical protein
MNYDTRATAGHRFLIEAQVGVESGLAISASHWLCSDPIALQVLPTA